MFKNEVPVKTIAQENIAILENELAWFSQVLDTRIKLYFEQECAVNSIYEIQAPAIKNKNSHYAQLIKEHNFGFDERILIVLALIPHIRPQLLDTFFIQNTNFSRSFTEFGGWKGETHGGFLPTGETASFILAGKDLKKRFDILTFFEDEHTFKKNNILSIENNIGKEPFLSGAIVISTEYLNKFTTGIYHKPDYNLHFPAKLITTKLNWSDLVLTAELLDDINDIASWVKHSTTIMDDWKLDKFLKPGYRALFYGPPGTGKTLTASLIGKSVGLDVYRIDLSMVISKYIGETEKNLSSVFDQAENKNWILFFDEADALFGKRTSTSSSNDRYANQEVSYLLQRIEDFPGIVILATNLKSNIDEAFARRFQSIIHFPMPEPEQRLNLWENILPKDCPLENAIDMEEIANKYEISGGAIINVVRFAVLKALQNKQPYISGYFLLKGIAKELNKEGKTI